MDVALFLTEEYLIVKNKLAFLLVLFIGTGAGKNRHELRYQPFKIECQQALIGMLEVSATNIHFLKYYLFSLSVL